MTDNIVIRKAQRSRAFMKLGVSGPSGSGKTVGALFIAFGMTGDWEKVCLIDTENGSGELYADSVQGDTPIGQYGYISIEPDFTPERYIAAVAAAEKAGYEVIVIDSATHEWDGKGGCLEIVDKLGGKYQDWAKVTPRHRRFIDAILQTPAHFIVTMRTKQDYAVETKDGKTSVRKLGMKEVQREGTEYELTINFNVSTDNHYAKASKDRTGLFMERPEFVITPKVGREILEWNKLGKEPAKDYSVAKQRIATELSRLRINPKTMPDFKFRVSALTGIEWKDENLHEIARALQNADGSLDDDSRDELPPPSAEAGQDEEPTVDWNKIGKAPAPAPAVEKEKPAKKEMAKKAKTVTSVLSDYRSKLAAAKTLDEVEEISGTSKLDKDVVESKMLTSTILGLVNDRIMELTSSGTSSAGAAGKCGDCDGKGVIKGTDCAACDGTGLR